MTLTVNTILTNRSKCKFCKAKLRIKFRNVDYFINKNYKRIDFQVQSCNCTLIPYLYLNMSKSSFNEFEYLGLAKYI